MVSTGKGLKSPSLYTIIAVLHEKRIVVLIHVLLKEQKISWKQFQPLKLKEFSQVKIEQESQN